MTTFDELYNQFGTILPAGDPEELRQFSQRVRATATPLTEALAEHALGIAHCTTGPYSAALQHLQNAVVLYQEEGKMNIVASVTSSIGTVLLQTGEREQALEHFHRALSIFEASKAHDGIAVVLDNISSVHYHAGDYEQAIDYANRAVALFEELGDRLRLASVTNSLGIVYYRTQEYPKTLECYRRALAIYEELDNRGGIATITGNIGSLHFDAGAYSEALDHMLKAVTIHAEVGNSEFEAIVNGNIGSVYRATGSYQQAIEYYRRSLLQLEEIGNRRGVAQAWNSIGQAYSDGGQMEEGLAAVLRSLSMFEELGDEDGIARALGSQAVILLAMGELDKAESLLARQERMSLADAAVRVTLHLNRARLFEHRSDLDQAHEQMLEALRIASDRGLKADLATCHERLRDLAQKRNDFAAYVEHNTQFAKISEKLRGREAIQRLAMLDAERRVEAELQERDKERALLYGALPEKVAARMLKGEDVSGDLFNESSVLFLDIVGFTKISDRIPPGHVVHLLKTIFRVCDATCKHHGLTKIKTIGDSYMAVAGVPEPLDDHVQKVASAAIDMMKGLNELELTMNPALGDTSWTTDVGEIKVRIGLHCGPVVAGIVGDERLQYDVWGDTVNVASRMESTGEPGRIQCSEAFVGSLTSFRGDATSRHPDGGEADEGPQANTEPWNYRTVERGTVEVKGKGSMTTYWLEGA